MPDFEVRARLKLVVTPWVVICGLASVWACMCHGSAYVILGWSPVPGTTIGGYDVWYGAVSHSYTGMVSVGEAASVTIRGLDEGATYFFAATAQDTSGLRSDFSNEVIYRVPDPTVSLVCSGSGTIAPNLTAQHLRPGRIYTVTAIPAAGQEFAGWGGSITSSAAKLSFRLTSSLTFVANFVPSPFPSVQGTYSGLFRESGQVRPPSAGSFTVSVAKRGTYSGVVCLGGRRYAISGRLDLQRQATKLISRPGTNALTLQLSVGGGGQTDQVTGTLTDGSWMADIYGERLASYSVHAPAPEAGAYTLRLPGQDGDHSLPMGDGFESVQVSSSGQARLGGMLADGTRISQGGLVSTGHRLPVYAALYSGKGLALGWITFTHGPSDEIAAELVWIKPANGQAVYYPAGYTLGYQVSGVVYVQPGGARRMLNLTNATLSFSGGNLATDFTNAVALSASGQVANLSVNRLSMRFSRSTGTFQGSVIDPSSGRSLPFWGAISQELNMGYGFLLYSGQSSRVGLAP